MKLKKIILQNFRGYREKTYIDVDDFTAIIGRNDVGKSTILEALDIFFDNTKPDPGDGSIDGDRSKVLIGCVFSDYPKEIVIDSSNMTSLEKEFLLNDEDLLEVHKIYNCSIKKPACERTYILANHPGMEGCSNLLSLTNANLKKTFKELKITSNVDQTRNAELRQAIRDQFQDLNLQLTEVSLEKESGAKIWDSLSLFIPLFALFKSDRPSSDQDSEAQDPMKAAVKLAVQEQSQELQKLSEEVQIKVQKIANMTVEKLKDFSPDLARSLKPTVTTKSWDSLFSVSLTDEDEIPINKRGSGVRRLILLNFFRAQAEMRVGDSKRGIIYAIEEPETSQHPYNQKLLISTFQELVESQDCQIIMTTHTPVLVKNLNPSCIRFVKNVEAHPKIYPCNEENFKEIARELGVLTDHKVKCFFGVEGKHDIAFLKAVSKIYHNNNPEMPNLEVEENNGKIVFIPLGGSSLELWTSRMNGFNIPQFFLMDRDTQPPAQPKYKNFYDKFISEGHVAWITSKLELENYIHPSVISSIHPQYEGSGNDFEDVPKYLAKCIHNEAIPTERDWDDVCFDSDKLKKKVSSAKKKINNQFVSNMTYENFLERDSEDEIRTWLKTIGDILNPA